MDTEATPGQAPELADGLIAWLAEERVILPRLIPCTLSGLGYPPGPNYTVAVVEPEPRWEQSTDDGYPRTDGVNVYTEWRMYPGMGADEVTCPHCGTSIPLCDEDFTPNQTWEELWTVIADRHEDGDGRWPCRACHRPVDLNDWQWSPQWGFGCLGLTFWNWPPLRPEFVAEVSRRLGHRLICPTGKV